MVLAEATGAELGLVKKVGDANPGRVRQCREPGCESGVAPCLCAKAQRTRKRDEERNLNCQRPMRRGLALVEDGHQG